jgi:hypothetical protein
VNESTAGFFDSHPSDRDRIQQAHEENAAGIFHDTRPATELFSDFDALSELLTIEFYRTVLGPEVKLTDLHAVDQLISRQDREDEAFKAFRRYFQNAMQALRPLPFQSGCITPPIDPKALLNQLQRSREAMVNAVAGYKSAYTEFDSLDSHGIEAELAAALLRADFKIKPSTFKRRLTSMAEVQKSLSANNEQLALLLPRLQTFERAATVRIQTALELLQMPQLIAKLPDGEVLRRRTDDVFLATYTLGQTMPTLQKLRNVHNCVGLLFNQLDPNNQSEKLVTILTAEVKQLHILIMQIRDALMLVPYPLDHGHGKMSIAGYCDENTPPEDDYPAVFAASSKMLDQLPSVLIRMMAHLAQAAEQVEKAVGLPPLPEPKDDEKKSGESAAKATPSR